MIPITIAFVPTRGTATNKHAPSTAPSPSSPPQGTNPPRVDPDPTLNSFEAVMRAMDEELARGRGERTGANASGSSASKGKGKGKAETESEDIDIEAAMASELHASLDKGDEEDGEEEVDYQLIKNFLESFKSQAGMSGPVGNLVGRLQQGWTLPRDDS